MARVGVLGFAGPLEAILVVAVLFGVSRLLNLLAATTFFRGTIR